MGVGKRLFTGCKEADGPEGGWSSQGKGGWGNNGEAKQSVFRPCFVFLLFLSQGYCRYLVPRSMSHFVSWLVRQLVG